MAGCDVHFLKRLFDFAVDGIDDECAFLAAAFFDPADIEQVIAVFMQDFFEQPEGSFAGIGLVEHDFELDEADFFGGEHSAQAFEAFSLKALGVDFEDIDALDVFICTIGIEGDNGGFGRCFN